jgi:hypothetical protein
MKHQCLSLGRREFLESGYSASNALYQGSR